MRLLSLVAIAGTASAAAAAGEGLTTEGLKMSTGQFVESKLRRKSSTGRRSLRSSSNREKRDKDDDDMMSGKDDDDGYSHRAKSGKSGKADGKGKSGKGDKSNDDEWGHEELFYLLPTACPGECISSHVSGENDEFIDSIQQCEEHNEGQMWMIRSDESYIMIESYHQENMCIAVDFEKGDDQSMLARTCYNGELMLKDCDSDYGTEWYFTGGQLVNSLCWGAGLSSVMTVFFDNDNGDDDAVLECRKDVAVWGANDEAILKADTFLFVNRLPDAPFHIDNVGEAINGRGAKRDTVEISADEDVSAEGGNAEKDAAKINAHDAGNDVEGAT